MSAFPMRDVTRPPGHRPPKPPDLGRDGVDTSDGGSNVGKVKDESHLDGVDGFEPGEPGDDVMTWDGDNEATPMESPLQSSSDTEGSKDIAVDTAAIRAFAATAHKLIPKLEKAAAELEPVRVNAGSFPHALDLQSTVVGSSAGGGAGEGESLKPSNLDFLRVAIDVLSVTGDKCESVARGYDNTEDVNKADAQQLDEEISSTEQYVKQLTGSSGSATAGSDVTEAVDPAAEGDDTTSVDDTEAADSSGSSADTGSTTDPETGSSSTTDTAPV